MYAVGKAHPYKEACAWILTEVAHGRLEAVIDTEIIQEILYRYGAIQQWQVGVQMAENLLALMPVVLPVTVEDMQTAITLFTQYAPPRCESARCAAYGRHAHPPAHPHHLHRQTL
jgi:hypothetical protein